MNMKHPLPKAVALLTLVWVGGAISSWSSGPQSTAEGAGANHRSANRVRIDRRPHTPESEPSAEARHAEDHLAALRSLFAEDPERACREALALGTDAATAMVAEWVKLDPEAAIRWAASLQGDAREIILATLCTELASGDPTLATELAFMMAAGKARNEALAFVTSQWVTGHPAEGLQWARELEDPRTRAMVERQLLPAIASQDPLRALGYVTEEMQDPETRMAVIPGILQRWAQKNPEAATVWTRSISDPKLREQSLEGALRVWAHVDPANVHAWWSDQPAGAFRNEISVAMAGIMAQSDRRAALSYAESLDAGELQTLARQRASAP